MNPKPAKSPLHESAALTSPVAVAQQRQVLIIRQAARLPIQLHSAHEGVLGPTAAPLGLHRLLQQVEVTVINAVELVHLQAGQTCCWHRQPKGSTSMEADKGQPSWTDCWATCLSSGLTGRSSAAQQDRLLAQPVS